MSETPREPRVEWSDAELAALERLRGASPPPDLEDEVVDALAEAGLVGGGAGAAGGAGAPGAPPASVPARRAWGWAALAAAACLAAFLAGLSISDRGAGTGPTEAARTFLVLLYEDASYETPATPEEQAARVREYAEWAAELRERGVEVRGEELAPAAEAAWLARRGGEVVATAGAPAGAAGALAGYFVLEAPSPAAAVEIARTLPHLKHGGTVVVRRVVEH